MQENLRKKYQPFCIILPLVGNTNKEGTAGILHLKALVQTPKGSLAGCSHIGRKYEIGRSVYWLQRKENAYLQ